MSELLDQLLAGSDGGAWTAETVLFHLLLAFVLSQAIAWIYIWTHRGISYSRSTAQSLILLSLIVAFVMMAIGDSLARAFGLFGALALVRFRTPVKDTRDTTFLFIAVAIGISVGAGHVVLSIVGTIVVGSIAVYLDWTDFGARFAHDGLLRFRAPRQGRQEDEAIRILRRYCRRFILVHMQEAEDERMEISYQLQLFAPRFNRVLLEDLRNVGGIDGVSLLMQDRDSEP